MKRKIVLTALDSFTIEPKGAPERRKLLATLNKIEKENEDTGISKHFWAAGYYIRKAVEHGISQ